MHNLFIDLCILCTYAKLIISSPIYTFLSRIKNFGLKTATIRTFLILSGIPFFNYSSITNQISLGQSPSIFGLYLLFINNYSYILNIRVSKKYDNLNLKKFKIKNIPVEEFNSPTLGQLEEGVNLLMKQLEIIKRFIFIVIEGISRAPCFLVAYLIKYESMNIKDAVQFIKRKRYFINLLPEQINNNK